MNAADLTSSIPLNTVNTAKFDIELINYNNITSKNMTKSLEDLSTLKFANDDHTLKTDTFKELFDIEIEFIDDKNYYKFDCDQSLYDSTNTQEGTSGIPINKIVPFNGLRYYDAWYVYNTNDIIDITENVVTTHPNINKILINNTTKNIIYITEDYIKIRQDTFKYTYS